MMKLFVLIALILLSSMFLFGQEKTKKELREIMKVQLTQRVDSLVRSKEIIFIAQSALPYGGEEIRLSSYYNLRIHGDSVEAYLPYFGRAYVVDHGNTEGGIKFSAPMQKYEVKQKKGSYYITFEAKAPSDIYRLNLMVTPSGYCTLTVNCNNRQGINFDGVLDRLGI